MALQSIFQEIRCDLPWADRIRLIVGPSASRETVKDSFFDLCAREPAPEGMPSGSVLPALAIQTLSELAQDILKKAGHPGFKPLSAQSRTDAVFSISKSEFAKRISPQLTKHLENRQVAQKIAQFLVELDRHYLSEGDLWALVEVLGEKNEDRKRFIELIATLWKEGQLPQRDKGEAWSDGQALRQAAEALDQIESIGIEKIYFWAFLEFTPLEEAFLEKLSSKVSLEFLFFEDVAQIFSNKTAVTTQMAFGQVRPVATQKENYELWNPHSPFDEIAFLKQALQSLRQKQVPYSEIALFVPDDDLYKRMLRHHLYEWNVPMRDPTLKGEWRDKPDWIYCRDFLRLLSSGLKQEDLRSWLSVATKNRKEFFDSLYAQGFYGGIAKLKKVPAEKLPEEIHLIFEAMPIFGKSLTPQKFQQAVSAFFQKHPKFEILNKFAEHLCNEREYLQDISFRLSKINALFDEFLEAEGRKESQRNLGGVHMVSQKVLLAQAPKYSFVLSANRMAETSVSYDLWEWEGLEVRSAWQKLHFGLSRIDRIRRDQVFLHESVKGSVSTVVSSVDYTLQGKPVSKGVFFSMLQDQAVALTCTGGHESVGWDYLNRRQNLKPTEVQVTRADLAQRFVRPMDQSLSLRVSEFEDYLKCPFLFYSRHVLKLERENELGLDAAAMAQGKVLHAVLEQWMRQDLKQPFTFDTGSTYLQRLVEDEVSRLGVLPGIYSHPHLLDRAKKALKSQALRWLEWEFKNRSAHPEMRTYCVEKPLELELPLKTGSAQTTLILRGKVDRVDFDGKNAVVVDYKTGSQAFRGQELLQGLGVQLLAYLTAISRTEGLTPAGAYYLSIKQKVSIEGGVFQKKFLKKLYTVGATNKGITSLEFEEFIQPVFEHWSKKAEQLRAGEFTAAPARPQKDCPSCAYKKGCGYKQASGTEEGIVDG